jgi:hypothetical protein
VATRSGITTLRAWWRIPSILSRGKDSTAGAQGDEKVRLAALAVLIIGNLLVNQSHAEDFSSQPLTRADCYKAELAWDESANVCTASSGDLLGQPLTRLDCEKAGMAWNEAANVCGAGFQAAEALPNAQLITESQRADDSSQPHTRSHCEMAGMTWNDTANVCDLEQEQSVRTIEPQPVASTILINIDKAAQKMTVSVDGNQRYEWPVSTGLRGYTTPSGAYTASSMNKIWYSKQWDNAPMPHALFFTKEGHAIHGTYEVKRLGKPASHGCVRLSPENAATLFALVEKTGLKNTQVMLAGHTPGGEGKVASVAKTKPSSRRPSHSFKRGNNDYAESFRPRRGKLFRRLFGGL